MWFHVPTFFDNSSWVENWKPYSNSLSELPGYKIDYQSDTRVSVSVSLLAAASSSVPQDVRSFVRSSVTFVTL